MSRRKINPIPLLKQPHDQSFPTKLQNRHITRFGNPATELGAMYFVSDNEGLRQMAVDLEYLRLIIDGVPITNTLARIIEDRVRREQFLLNSRISTQGVPENLRHLLEIERKADVQKYLRKQHLSEYDLFLLIHNCQQIKWNHRSKFPEYVPYHLQLTDKDRSQLNQGELKPMTRKLSSTMEERRRIHVHLFEQNLMWHCFYFTYDDLQVGSNSHWEHGPHLHYVNHLWPKYSKDEVWSIFDTRQNKISGNVHVRFNQFEYSSSNDNFGDKAFSRHFGFQPMLAVLDENTHTNPNIDPIPIAQIATRGFWSSKISFRPDCLTNNS